MQVFISLNKVAITVERRSTVFVVFHTRYIVKKLSRSPAAPCPALDSELRAASRRRQAQRKHQECRVSLKCTCDLFGRLCIFCPVGSIHLTFAATGGCVAVAAVGGGGGGVVVLLLLLLPPLLSCCALSDSFSG